ncbi:MAG TPA: UDP-N-acetylglucosamine 4,6-dehydratase (inverting) [Phycisphaerae bacterium]|nr:UDP-N-acetylglucosamine 4,6-dehydratase (inverting) [Phycisphaerales bacterium]HRX86411.1 UDP-N-acetylglucosamine 4,6-dehydratase (inverting) [Phycisphaerae bacterium]
MEAGSRGLRWISIREDRAIDWTSATILVTGGTGSFGRRFIDLMLRDYQPRKIIIYSRDEWKQHEMRTAGYDHPNLRYFIGDVRDVDRLRRATQGVDLVVHAAALKQVPACEYNPIEAVKTNINGAMNIIEAALDSRVRRVLALSTDKATAPVNIYGATKLVAEKLFAQANAYSRGEPHTLFSCVRYGNVLGSRGSVLPLFQQQRDTVGRLTLTDRQMTRFWMTLDDGVKFVAHAVEQMVGGEVFIPKLPATRIVDLAKAIAPDCPLDLIGLRPGEKLHESLISPDEALLTLDVGDGYVLLPNQPARSVQRWVDRGRKVPAGFHYTSETAERRLPSAELLAPYMPEAPVYA